MLFCIWFGYFVLFFMPGIVNTSVLLQFVLIKLERKPMMLLSLDGAPFSVSSFIADLGQRVARR